MSLQRWQARERLIPKVSKKNIRKPVEIKCWFGDKLDTETSSLEDESTWMDMDRQKKKEDKRKQ